MQRGGTRIVQDFLGIATTVGAKQCLYCTMILGLGSSSSERLEFGKEPRVDLDAALRAIEWNALT